MIFDFGFRIFDFGFGKSNFDVGFADNGIRSIDFRMFDRKIESNNNDF